jgi:hypothetical protein
MSQTFQSFAHKMFVSIEIPGAQFIDHSESIMEQSHSVTATPRAGIVNASPLPTPSTANKENRELSPRSAILSALPLKPPDKNASLSATAQTPDKKLPIILGTEGSPHSTSPDDTSPASITSAHIPDRQYLRNPSTGISSLSAIQPHDNALPLQSFDPFPKLPFELRLRIWKSIDNLSTHDICITVTTPSKEADIKRDLPSNSTRLYPSSFTSAKNREIKA